MNKYNNYIHKFNTVKISVYVMIYTLILWNNQMKNANNYCN